MGAHVTFFMIVTDSCAPIAHYCIQSYRRLAKTGLRFWLVVYGNCLSKETEERYYPKWRRLDYVDLMDNREIVGDKPPVPGETIVTPERAERFAIREAEAFFTTHPDVTVVCAAYHRQDDAEVLKKLFKEWGYETAFSDGAMLFLLDRLAPPYFRHGVLHAKKG